MCVIQIRQTQNLLFLLISFSVPNIILLKRKPILNLAAWFKVGINMNRCVESDSLWPGCCHNQAPLCRRMSSTVPKTSVVLYVCNIRLGNSVVYLFLLAALIDAIVHNESDHIRNILESELIDVNR